MVRVIDMFGLAGHGRHDCHIIKKNYLIFLRLHEPIAVLLSRTSNCIHCGNYAATGFIQLKQSSIIEPACLREVEYMAINEDIDQEIRQIYEHIVSLVLKCTLCKGTIDGFKVSIANGREDNPICSKCFKLPEGKERPQQGECLLCGIKLYGAKYSSAVHLDGCLICEECYTQQYKEAPKC